MSTLDETAAMVAPPADQVEPVQAVPDASLVDAARNVAAQVDGRAPEPGPGQTATLDGAPPLEVSSVFNEAATTAGITLIIETADEVVISHFAEATLKAGGTKADADKFQKMARLNPALKPATIKGAVEMCRSNGWNIDPKHVFYVAMLAWGRGILMASKGLKDIQRINEPAKTAAKPCETPAIPGPVSMVTLQPSGEGVRASVR